MLSFQLKVFVIAVDMDGVVLQVEAVYSGLFSVRFIIRIILLIFLEVLRYIRSLNQHHIQLWSAIYHKIIQIEVDTIVIPIQGIRIEIFQNGGYLGSAYELLPEVKELLLQLKDEQEEYRKAFGRAWQDTGYIFVHPDGSPRRPDCITRGFQRVLKNNGLRRMRFHDLRHSTASILHDKGWDLRDIQDWLRHADIETTANIYTHISSQRKTKMAKDMENTFRL